MKTKNNSKVESKKYVIALDQGTTSSRAIIFDKNMNINSSAIDQGKDKPSRHATEEEKTKYEKEIKEEINKL